MKKVENVITVESNDAVDSGYVELSYSRTAAVSPLHLKFKRNDGYECSMSLTHASVKELLKLIVNQL